MTLETPVRPLSCNLNAFTAVERQRWRELGDEMRAGVVERVELPDGYAFRLGAPASLANLGEWMALERRCSPFFRFFLEVEEGAGPMWLSLTGPEGVKKILV